MGVLVSWSMLHAAAAAELARSVNVRELGAAGDGKKLETTVLQGAIDAIAERGGGTVVFPPGDYLTGSLTLKSNVTMRLEAGSTIWGSTNLEHYPENIPQFRSYTDEYVTRSLIYAESAEHAAIVGQGTIDGNGHDFSGPYKVRPYLMRFVTCRHLTVDGITLRDSPMWVQHYLGCEDVRITNVTVRSPDANYNNDGIDIDSCQRVLISGCNIHSEDDAVCLKSTADKPCKDIMITHCILESRCNAFKLGTESVGGFQNITITNSTVFNTRLAGVAIETVDGGNLERIVVSNLTMDRVGTPIFIRRGARLRQYRVQYKKHEQPGVLRDVVISNITASRCGDNSCPIAGLPGFDIENVILQNLMFDFDGGGTDAMARRAVPERPETYPDYDMFGELPAYGFYVRHVKGLRMDNVMLRYDRDELRPAIVLDDVKNFNLSGLAAKGQTDRPLISARDLAGAFVHDCWQTEPVGTFLSLVGAKTSGIVMQGNDLKGAATVIERGRDVPKSAVR